MIDGSAGAWRKVLAAADVREARSGFRIQLRAAGRRRCVRAMLSLYIMTAGGGAMAQLTVRNVPDNLARALRVRAARHGRSAESEHRLILAQALESEEADFWGRADAFRSRTRAQKSDSAQLLREMRDAR